MSPDFPCGWNPPVHCFPQPLSSICPSWPGIKGHAVLEWAPWLLPSGADLRPGTALRLVDTGYAEILVYVRQPNSLKILVCFHSMSYQFHVECNKNSCMGIVLNLRTLSFIIGLCPLFYSPPILPLNLLLTSLRQYKTLLIPSLPENCNSVWGGTDSTFSKWLWHCSQRL